MTLNKIFYYYYLIIFSRSTFDHLRYFKYFLKVKDKFKALMEKPETRLIFLKNIYFNKRQVPIINPNGTLGTSHDFFFAPWYFLKNRVHGDVFEDI